MNPLLAGVLAGATFFAGAAFVHFGADEPERDPFAEWWNCGNFDDVPPSWSDLIANDELIVNGGKSMAFPFQCSTMDGVRHFSDHLTLNPAEVCDLLSQHQPPIRCTFEDAP